jgi:hypothetical protein
MQAASTEGDGERRPDRRDALVALLVAVALFGLFVAVQWAALLSFDGKVALSTAHAMAEGRLHLLPSEDPTKHHYPYSHYGIGTPLVLLPLYLLQRALAIQPYLLESLAGRCCWPRRAPCCTWQGVSLAGAAGCRWPGLWSSAP